MSFAPRGVSRAGQLRGPQGRPPRPRVGPAAAPPLPAPPRAPEPTRSARGRPAPPGPLPPPPTAGARSRTATPEGTGSCQAEAQAQPSAPPAPGSLTVASAGHATGKMSREEDRKSRVQKDADKRSEWAGQKYTWSKGRGLWRGRVREAGRAGRKWCSLGDVVTAAFTPSQSLKMLCLMLCLGPGGLAHSLKAAVLPEAWVQFPAPTAQPSTVPVL